MNLDFIFQCIQDGMLFLFFISGLSFGILAIVGIIFQQFFNDLKESNEKLLGIIFDFLKFYIIISILTIIICWNELSLDSDYYIHYGL